MRLILLCLSPAWSQPTQCRCLTKCIRIQAWLVCCVFLQKTFWFIKQFKHCKVISDASDKTCPKSNIEVSLFVPLFTRLNVFSRPCQLSFFLLFGSLHDRYQNLSLQVPCFPSMGQHDTMICLSACQIGAVPNHFRLRPCVFSPVLIAAQTLLDFCDPVKFNLIVWHIASYAMQQMVKNVILFSFFIPTLSSNIQTDTKIVSLFHDILNYSKFGLAYCICFYLLSILRWIRNSLCLWQILPEVQWSLNGLWLPGAENRLAGVWAKSRAWWRESIKLYVHFTTFRMICYCRESEFNIHLSLNCFTFILLGARVLVLLLFMNTQL